MPARYLVIGSNSFSGASFVDHLLELGCEVVGTSRSQEVAVPFRPYAWRARPGRFSFHRIDLNHDLDSLDAVLAQSRPSRIVNFAAQSMVAESWRNPDHWMTTNVVSTARLFERLRHLDYLERYVHVTTPEVYGSTGGWIKESDHFDPSTPYAVSRAAGDMLLKSFFRAYGFPALFTRAANVYGPGQQLYRIIPRTIVSALAGERLPLHGGGQSERSFIHVHDVATATSEIAERGEIGASYHISTRERVSIRALVQLILDRLGKRFDDCVDVVEDRLGKDQSYMLDSQKLREELGWKDQIDLEAGVQQTIDWVRENFDVLRRLPREYQHKA